MISAFFYLLGNSWKNRTMMRLRRMKQPKYLVGAIVGGAYLFLYMFRFLLNPNRFGGGWNITPENRLLFESAAAMIFGGLILLSWIVPHERAALVFSEAEVAFLFPAPVGRRKLIHYKLLKSQIGILTTTLIFTLIFRRSISSSPGWIRGLGWWVIFSTMNLHFIGSSFARTMLMDRGISNWKRRVLVLALLAIAAGGIVYWADKTIPPPDPRDLQHLPDVLYYAKHVFESGPLPYLLYPFRLVVRPYLAANGWSFLVALWPALLLMAAHYLWVVRSNVAFEEASVEASKKMAERVAAIRTRGRAPSQPKKKKKPPFELSPTGWPAVALFWKNLFGAGQGFTWRFWLVLMWLAIVVCIPLGMHPRTFNLSVVLGSIAAMFLGMSFLIGPQFVRQDFRQDLPMADVLKAFPIRGWQVALGELLAPAAILTGVQWLLVVFCLGLSANFGQDVTLGMRLAIASAVVIVAPFLNLVSLLVPNAAVLMFPGWIQTGKESAQGIEATGQRLIFALGQFLVFIVALAPAALLFLLILFVARAAAGGSVALAMPIGAVVAATILAGEAALGLMALGKLFERFDVSAESGS